MYTFFGILFISTILTALLVLLFEALGVIQTSETIDCVFSFIAVTLIVAFIGLVFSSPPDNDITKKLNPGDSLSVSVKTNWFYPLIIIALIIAIIILLYIEQGF